MIRTFLVLSTLGLASCASWTGMESSSRHLCTLAGAGPGSAEWRDCWTSATLDKNNHAVLAPRYAARLRSRAAETDKTLEVESDSAAAVMEPPPIVRLQVRKPWQFLVEDDEAIAEVATPISAGTTAILSLRCNSDVAYSVFGCRGVERIADPVVRNVVEQTSSKLWSEVPSKAIIETYRRNAKTSVFAANGFHRDQGDKLTYRIITALKSADAIKVRTRDGVVNLTGKGSDAAITVWLRHCSRLISD